MTLPMIKWDFDGRSDGFAELFPDLDRGFTTNNGHTGWRFGR